MVWLEIHDRMCSDGRLVVNLIAFSSRRSGGIGHCGKYTHWRWHMAMGWPHWIPRFGAQGMDSRQCFPGFFLAFILIRYGSSGNNDEADHPPYCGLQNRTGGEPWHRQHIYRMGWLMDSSDGVHSSSAACIIGGVGHLYEVHNVTMIVNMSTSTYVNLAYRSGTAPTMFAFAVTWTTGYG